MGLEKSAHTLANEFVIASSSQQSPYKETGRGVGYALYGAVRALAINNLQGRENETVAQPNELPTELEI